MGPDSSVGPFPQPQHCYVHIPFCLRKCIYCDFTSYAGQDALVEPYLAALGQEIRLWAAELGRRLLTTVYIGGGTPSLLSAEQVAGLLATLRHHYSVDTDAEVTLEANPGTVTLGQLEGYREAGVNRLSLGVQSLDDGELARLGRVHTAAEAREAMAMARVAGFANLSVDLLYAIPEQNPQDWRLRLQEIVSFRPEHVSCYALTVEEGTPLAGMVERGELVLPDEDVELEMFEMAREVLGAAGYEHYEISNFALPGRRCRHNVGYWQGNEHVGFGAAAHSYLDGVRQANADGLTSYLDALNGGRSATVMRERLPPERALGEAMMLGLRMLEGVDFGPLEQRFGIQPGSHYQEPLAELIGAGLIECTGRGVRLTERGLPLANEVAVRLL